MDLALLVVSLIAVLACVASFLLGRRLAPRADAPDDARAAWRALAEASAELGDYRQALDATRRARALDPRDATLLLDEAWMLARLGRLGEAADAYERAGASSSDGMPELLGAMELLEGGGSLERAEALTLRAIAKAPLLAWEVLRAAPALASRPAVAEAIRRARERAERETEPDGFRGGE